MRELKPFERYLIHEFVDDWRDGYLTRREMIKRVLYITGGVATTATVLTQLGVTPMTRAALAQETVSTPSAEPMSPLSVAADDSRVLGEDITFPAGDGTDVLAYQARPNPDSGTPMATVLPPLVLICHENRGLTEHIRDVARRYAVEGYVACAVDLLSRNGGFDAIADPAEIPGLLSGTDAQVFVDDFKSALAYYQEQPFVDVSRPAMTGFCFGGGITWLATTQMPELKAAAPYYGPPPPLDQVPNITAAVLGVYSDDPEDFANEGREELEAALTDAGVTFEFIVYPDTQHAFHNDTGQRYNQEQALQAREDTLAWFRQYV
ncbi:MAG: dienelactone hydrolase family protein [Thermomicrobiales bacterium]|nr:dienelactone hydrolase family protein [Thermomicrobiales bacterium]